MILGFLFAVLACAIWGLIYIFPLILPEYDPVLIASARFAVYGLAFRRSYRWYAHVLDSSLGGSSFQSAR